MRRKLSLITAGLLLMGSVVFADTGERKDSQVFNDIANTVSHYAQFTIFDDIDATVSKGVVTLTGDVTMGYKRDDIEKRVAKVDGVRQVVNKINVLPASMSDDSLRYRIARAIYGNPNFWNYAIGPNQSIHVVVDNGHVTLTGVVNNDADRTIARSLVNQFPALSVTNDLKTNAEAQAAREAIK